MSTPTPKNQMTRRQFLARSGALGALGLSLPAFLAACGGSDSSSSGGSESLFFDNWPLYVDPTASGRIGVLVVDRVLVVIRAVGVQADVVRNNESTVGHVSH